MKKKKNRAQETNFSRSDAGSSRDQQAVDKAPGEERGSKEKVSRQDLKGKKVDADLSRKNERAQ